MSVKLKQPQPPPQQEQPKLFLMVLVQWFVPREPITFKSTFEFLNAPAVRLLVLLMLRPDKEQVACKAYNSPLWNIRAHRCVPSKKTRS